MAKLCLGTVQFGMRYGINNVIGRQPTWEESFEMLDYAFQNGITIVDTAKAYGEAELILGRYFKERGRSAHVKVISKLRPNVIELNEKDITGVLKREIEDSLRCLGIPKLDGYLLHTPEYIYNHIIIEGLEKLKKSGYTDHIGVSIYDLKEGYAALETGIIDYVQLPYSILDQRGIKDGFIPKAKTEGLKIFTRSAFLQGLFMMDRNAVPCHLQNAVSYLEIMEKVLRKYNVDKVSAILKFVESEEDIDYLVFGVEQKGQLEEDITKSNQGNVPGECIQELKEQINNVEQSVIFPSLWSNGRKCD